MDSRLKELISKSKSIVFFGGAGVSTESGIPDFRSVDGLYNTEYDYPPEVILSHDFFIEHPDEFFRFYRNKMLFPNALPNAAHNYLASLEKQDKLKTVITQNIDGLHQLAGNNFVYELHGSVHRNYCMSCGKMFDLSFVLSKRAIPYCDCGGIVKPDVVLYGESLDGEILRGSIEAIGRADMLIVGGTSLAVYPAAGLVNYYNGNRLVLINKTPTPVDNDADLVLRGNIGEELSE